ncbi:uncharacterized protein EI90DRAFT_3119977 [Cantharellus anzutake]|uniref:uncharacterized protein n=1 Tax=Cantharellus anzutake TaxID=1750568 RepID=UPI00190851A1|nr:uncharacterized protein EI90DRAFT_3119977 [Cantharellus anzutake]KAF8335690.1 hypothetical protein EI90DRAFT_3119977 [Cantharellus anzutake]
MTLPFSTDQIPSLTGKIALITGGNNGIGFETVRQLALHGAKVPNTFEGEDAIQRLKEAHPEATLDLHCIQLVLDDLQSVLKCSDAFLSREKRLDILICNAGIMVPPYQLTKDGYEQQFQREWQGIWTSKSDRHALIHSSPHNFFDLFHSPDFTSKQAVNRRFGHQYLEWTTHPPSLRYSQSKLANILFAREINKREVVMMLRLSRYIQEPSTLHLPWGFGNLIRKVLISPANGALSSLYAATSSEIEEKDLWDTLPGAYGYPIWRTKYSTDPKLAEDLWNLSEALLVEKFPNLVLETLSSS